MIRAFLQRKKNNAVFDNFSRQNKEISSVIETENTSDDEEISLIPEEQSQNFFLEFPVQPKIPNLLFSNSYSESLSRKQFKMTAFFKKNPQLLKNLAYESGLKIEMAEENFTILGAQDKKEDFFIKLYKIQSKSGQNVHHNPKILCIECQNEDLNFIEISFLQDVALKTSPTLANIETEADTASITGDSSTLLDISQELYTKKAKINHDVHHSLTLGRTKVLHFPLTSSLRLNQDQIKTLAISMDIDINVLESLLIVQGSHTALQSFSEHLKLIESNYKTFYYPKYWDTSIVESKLYIEVPDCSDEFETTSEMFNKTLPKAKVTKLVRVHNAILMENYIKFQQKWIENNPGKPLNKKLLFHGTKLTDPKKVAMNDIGFDLQYARAGLYGYGLYFAVNSIYSHAYAHRLKSNKFSMIIAEVVTGESKACLQIQKNMTSAQDGYDSILANLGTKDEFYVIYKNYFSYPLYIIEYNYDEIDVSVPRIFRQGFSFQNTNQMNNLNIVKKVQGGPS